MTEDKPSRFAELAVEIVGAKAAAEFIRDVWREAPAEARAELAAAVLKRISDAIASNGYEVRREIERVVGAAAGAEAERVIAEHRANLEQLVWQQFDKLYSEVVQRAVQQRLDAAVREVREKFERSR